MHSTCMHFKHLNLIKGFKHLWPRELVNIKFWAITAKKNILNMPHMRVSGMCRGAHTHARTHYDHICTCTCTCTCVHMYFIICTIVLLLCTQSQISACAFMHIKENYLWTAISNVGTLLQFIYTPRGSAEMRDTVHALLNGSCMQILECFWVLLNVCTL